MLVWFLCTQRHVMYGQCHVNSSKYIINVHLRSDSAEVHGIGQGSSHWLIYFLTLSCCYTPFQISMIALNGVMLRSVIMPHALTWWMITIVSVTLDMKTLPHLAALVSCLVTAQSACNIRPQSANQRNAIQMVFCWWADSGPRCYAAGRCTIITWGNAKRNPAQV